MSAFHWHKSELEMFETQYVKIWTILLNDIFLDCDAISNQNIKLKLKWYQSYTAASSGEIWNTNVCYWMNDVSSATKFFTGKNEKNIYFKVQIKWVSWKSIRKKE